MNYYQIVDSRRQVSPIRAKCMRSLGDNVGECKYEIVEVPYSDNVFELIKNVDSMKFDIAASDPEACVVDTDCFVVTPLHTMEDMKKDVPYFARYEFNTTIKGPDFSYFYVNGCCDYFKKNLNKSMLSDKQYSVSPEVITRLTGFVYIPEMSYCHFYDTMGKLELLKYADKAKKSLRELDALRLTIKQAASIMRLGE